jgi:hypothetical protein
LRIGNRHLQQSTHLRVERRPGLFGELKSAFGPDVVDDDGGDRVYVDARESDGAGWRRG